MFPGLQRLYHEMTTFQVSALSDLNYSIQKLEKARTDYRAALLWMKDVSAKLHDPDYRDQLIRFREVEWGREREREGGACYAHGSHGATYSALHTCIVMGL